MPVVTSRLSARRSALVAAIAAFALIVTSMSVAAPAHAADTTAPGKPGSLSASYFGGIGTVITWGKVSASDLAGYRLYRSASSSMSTSNSTLIADTTDLKATDATAVTGAKYYYAVASYDTSGNASALSSTKAVTATDTTKPNSPSSLKATVSSAGIALDWSDSTAVDLAGYTVVRSTASSGPWTTLATGLVNSAYTDTTAPVAVKSYYRVTSVDLAGNASSYASTSATRTGTAPAAVAPAAPGSFTAKLTGAGVPSLTWSAATGATSYTLTRATDAAGPFTTVGTAVTGTSFTDTSAPAKVTVHYRLTAVNSAGASPAVSTSIAVPGDEVAPKNPSGGKATVLPTGGMSITWKANTDADLAGYLVLKRDKARGGYFPYLGSAEAPYALTSFSDLTVAEGTVAYFRILAVDASGNVSESYNAVTANNPNVKPKTPSNLRVTQDPIAGLALSWNAPADYDLAGYTVYRNFTSSSSTGWALLDNITVDAAGPSPAFRDTSAPKGITVYYRIVAIDAVGNVSSNSSTVSGTSLTDPIPLPIVETVLTVGADKEFATIGDAVATVPRNNLRRYRIDIDPGTYNEVLRVRSSYITFNGLGADPAATVISSAQASGSPDPAAPGETLGTSGSYVMFVDATDVTLRNLTVANTFDEAAHPEIDDQQAVALRVEGDRFVANRVRLIGNQDTLLADTPKPTTRIRQYYVDSYIEGDVDYVFGAANAVFDRVTFRSLDRSKSNNGYVTAASTDVGSKYGFLIWDSKITSSAATGTVNLGRPWHPSADKNAQGSVVIMNTWLGDAIDGAAPWDDMTTRNSSGVPVLFPWTTGRFFEADNFGPGAVANEMRPVLDAKEAAKLTPEAQLSGKDGWNPVVVTADAPPATPAHLVASTDVRLVNLAWDDDESAAVVGWNVYRAAEDGAFEQIGTTSTASFADTTVTTGAAYRYVVTAKTRHEVESAPSDELAVTVAKAVYSTDFRVDPAAPASATSFPTLAEALAAAPAGTSVDPTVIELAPGRYKEYQTVTKPYTILRGTADDASAVVITGNRASGEPTGAIVDGLPETYGTSGSASFVITASNVRLENLTVENDYVEGTYLNGQAVALRTTGDRIVLDNVRLLGNQDTFYANSATRTSVARVYVTDSFIEGDVDFIFGRATVVIDRSTLHVTDHGTNPNGALTAASTSAGNPFGFLITHSRVIGDAPDNSQNLGRPWQPGITQPDLTSIRDTDAIAQVVVRDTWLGPVVSQTAWTDMVNSGENTTWQTGRFAEYSNSGPGAAVSTTDRAQLTDVEAAGFTAATYLAGTDGWNPVAEIGEDTAPRAVTGLTATGADRKIALSWDDSSEVDVVRYRVYASDTSTVDVNDAHLIAEVEKASFAEVVAANDTTRHYRVVAVDLAGNVSDASAVVSATSLVPPLVADITVATDGSGDYTSLQAALVAAPAGTAAKPTVIVVEPGVYREVVNSARAHVLIAGATGDARDVTVVFGNANGTAASTGTCPFVTTATCGTFGSATVTLTGVGAKAQDITFANDFDRASNPTILNTQAVALRATGDRQVYSNVRLLGHQDTLNADASGNISADGSGYPRQYYVDSYIEGDVDFVFGRASAVFERVTFHALERSGGVVFAPSTASKSKGYLVVDSRFSSDNDAGTFYFGRPWRSWADGAFGDDSRGQVVIRDSYVAAGFNAVHPWTDFSPLVWNDGRFAEYGSTGPGVTVSADRPLLSAEQAASTTTAGWLSGTDGWDPTRPFSPSAPAAPQNLTATATSGSVSLDWDENGEAGVRGYQVHRDGALIGTVLDSEYTDAEVVDGETYAYTVIAVDALGRESAASQSITATPQLTIDATVAADGSGDFTSLADAVAAASAGWVIQLAPGTYAGTTTISKSVTVVGSADASAVVLTNATSAATLSIPTSGVTVRGLTIENASASGTAPALSMTGDKIVIADSVLRSSVNRTVFADTSTYTAAARQLITGSTIVGGNDIFLGRATLVIHDSTIVPRTNGTVLTPSTAANQKGFLLLDSTIDTSASANVQLGRPYRAWADTFVPNSVGQAVVRDTELGAGIKPAAWGIGPANEPASLGRFAEYGNSGAGAVQGGSRPQLSAIESVDVTALEWLGAATWYPAIADPESPADLVAPDPATALTAVGADASVSLAWEASASADVAAYRVYRATGSTVAIAPANLVATVTGATGFADTGLANGVTYSYAVVSVDAAGNPGAAAQVTATPNDTVPPAAPTGLAAVPGHAKATLTWSANTEADLARYLVYRDGEKVGEVAAPATSFADTGLDNGTAYSYTISAVDTLDHESERSGAITATPSEGDAIAPAAPSNVGTELGKSTATVTWSAPADEDVAEYRIRRDGTEVATLAVPATRWTDPAVTVGTTYSYTVTAVDASGNESAPSNASTITPIKADVVVAADGSGDATTLQAVLGAVTSAGALDAANPGSLANNADFTTQGYRTIVVRPGTYTGPFVSGNRYGVRIVGATGDPDDVVLTAPGGAVATFAVSGNQWTFRDITVTSVAASAGAQATALQIKSGDKTVVENARLLGDAKTVLASTANATTYARVYIHDSYLEGGADLLLGRAVVVVDESTIHVLNRSGASLTDSSVNAAHPYGFLISDSTIVADGNAGSVFLGRPYPENATASAQVVVRGTELPAAINTGQPWKDYDAARPWTIGRFFEFENSGAGAGVGSTRPQLTSENESTYRVESYLRGTDGWNPAS